MGSSRRLLPALILAGWVLVVAAAVPLAGHLDAVAGDPDTVELPRGSEATDVAGLAARFPDAGTATAVLVYTRPAGLTAADRAKADTDRTALGTVTGVQGTVEPPRPSADGQALTLLVALPADDPDTAAAVRDLARHDAPPGLQVHITGEAGAALDARDGNERVARIAMLATAAVVTVLLLLTYRSPVLWLLPLLNSGVAIITADAVMYLLGRFLHVTVDAGNAAVLTVLVFGVGTDYALLVLARYRERLRTTPDRHAAMASALRGAVPAVGASAATVGLSLLCLLTADMGFNFALGPAGAVAVAAAFAVMVTLLPAQLVLLGRWVFWPAVPRAGVPARPSRVWAVAGRIVARRPRLAWVATTVALGILALGALGMRTGLDDAHRFIGTPDAVAGQRQVEAHYGARTDRPVVVVVAPSAAGAAADRLRAVPGVAAVAAPVIAVDGTLARLDVTTATNTGSNTGSSVAADIRAAAGPGARIGGTVALEEAKTAAQAHDRRVVIPLVLLVVFAVLILLLRALVAPLLLIGTVVLSYFAALGTAWLAFTHLFGFPAMDVQVMLIGFLFLVALGVDYNIFLVSRIRQETVAHGHHDGVLRGLAVTGGVITSAGVVLAATFAVLMLAPLVAFVQIGFVVAAGVLIDTLLVRSLLVPTLALDVGRRFWWPSKPARVTAAAVPQAPADSFSAAGGDGAAR